MEKERARRVGFGEPAGGGDEFAGVAFSGADATFNYYVERAGFFEKKPPSLRGD
jgi:hypothetical protein